MAGKACLTKAFTLVELLVVMVIVGLLVAMLVPSVSAVWQSVLASKCRHNLQSIWGAYSMWRSDEGLAVLAEGLGWRVAIMPYLEGRDEILRCPAVDRQDRWGTSAGDSAGDEGDEEGGGGGTAPGAGAGAGTGGISLSDIIFKMYCRKAREGWVPGQYLGTAVVEECPGCAITHISGDKYYVAMEDRWFFTRQGWAQGLDDMRFNIWLDQGSPYKMEIVGGDEINGGEWGSFSEFRFELWIAGKKILDDWTAAYSFDLSIPRPVLDLTVYSKPGDYGISKGAYEFRGDETIPSLDPRQFLILDYPKAVADYNKDVVVGPDDAWDKYFILDEEAWMAKYSEELWEGETWEDYQSLRHFGQANMLFCDGHVESLGPDELYETNPLWEYIR
jgi:prepilin-type processing-associated H-X9-DG protein/prepilin-type N-terminal cleavage/methylation domain-containing protein